MLNGKEWHDWFTGKSGPRSDGGKAGVLTATSTDTNHWQVGFVPENPAMMRYEIHAALLAGGIVSEVKAGENKGRRLNHDFVAVNLVQIGMTTSNGVANGNFILNQSGLASGTTLALAVWVARAGELEPVQTTGGWLFAPPAK